MGDESTSRQIANLDQRLRQLEQVFRVKTNGGVDINVRGPLRVEATAGIEVISNTTIKLQDFHGNEFTMGPSGIAANAASKFSINAATYESTLGFAVSTCAHTQFSGVLQTDTIIATNVIGTSYTPGAGNLR